MVQVVDEGWEGDGCGVVFVVLGEERNEVKPIWCGWLDEGMGGYAGGVEAYSWPFPCACFATSRC